MRLREWATLNQVSYRTAYRYFLDGKIPGAHRVSERVILVPEPETAEDHKPPIVAVYARVSSADQKDQLPAQIERAKAFAYGQGLAVDRVVSEVASGMNPNRKKLTRLLSDPEVTHIIVEHRDRLARINADLIIAATPKEVLVADNSEPTQDDVSDIIDFMTSVCARRYGRRSARSRAKRIVQEL